MNTVDILFYFSAYYCVVANIETIYFCIRNVIPINQNYLQGTEVSLIIPTFVLRAMEGGSRLKKVGNR